MKERINALIAEYQDAIELLEQDRREEKFISVSNAYRTAKIGAYQKVVEDLTGILEGEEDD